LKLQRRYRAFAILREAQCGWIFRRDASNIAEFNGGESSALKNARAAPERFSLLPPSPPIAVSDCPHAEMHRPFDQ